MKSFLRSVLSTFFALLISLFGLLVVITLLVIACISYKPTVKPNSVLVLNLDNNFTESADINVKKIINKTVRHTGSSLPLINVVQALDHAIYDKSINALYLTGNINQTHNSGPAIYKDLHDAILRFKKISGKPVIAYNNIWNKWDYYICSSASKLYTSPYGGIDFTGMSIETKFYGNALKKIGIEVQVARAGKYKGAVEPYILDKMSQPYRQQITELLDDIWDDWKTSVANDRQLTKTDIQYISNTHGFIMANNAKEDGLIDDIFNVDQVLDELKALTGAKILSSELSQVSIDDYIASMNLHNSKNRIAVVVAEGEIADRNNSFDGSNIIEGDVFSCKLRELRLDPQVKAIVLRVNSPGGSSTASEIIQREIVLCRKEKPVIVSMGNVAASGGYAISTYADRIFAEPNSITGSIGVFMASLKYKKLANRHGVNIEFVDTSKTSGLSSSGFRPISVYNLSKIQNIVNNTYERFIEQVAISRNMTKKKVHSIAQGRVWSGRKALEIGLIDEIGGIQNAISFAAKLAKIDDNYQVDLVADHSHDTFFGKLISLVDDDNKSNKLFYLNLIKHFNIEPFMSVLLTNDNPYATYARIPYNLNVK